jgi:aldehyde:ferredoxin oxidoreductase
MRKYLDIRLKSRNIDSTDLEGEALVRAGRYLIAKTLLEENAPTVDPLGPDNPLIFSAGPLAGTSFSNANRISVGCKSPLTGGIKEANGGGRFAYGLGQQHIAGLTLHGISDDWVVIHLQGDGEITFDSAEPYMAKLNTETAKMLFEKYGKKIAYALCGPVGEYQGLLAGIAFNDNEGRPARLAARGGVGAVMGSKKVKAIVVDLDKMPTLVDKKDVVNNVRVYAKKLQEDPSIAVMHDVGTMVMADYTNHIGGLPTNNFTSGQHTDTDKETFRMGGSHIRELNESRGGKHAHACMPGCVIQCSNVYVDENGEEIASPIEYETLCLLGTNCGVSEPDQLARLNGLANDLGIDTIEAGATLAVLMDAGLAEFGDYEWMMRALDEIGKGTEDGKLWAQATARVGVHYGVHRVPVVKKQAISAYDPRVIEITGISMMSSAQGADHTAGNVPRYDSFEKSFEELAEVSLDAQINMAAHDSIGFCVFGRAVTNPHVGFIAETINSAVGTTLDETFMDTIGTETLKMEHAFNLAAGFSSADDELPKFFYDEPLAPSDRVARFHGSDCDGFYDRLSADRVATPPASAVQNQK